MFISPDPYGGSMNPANPGSFNRYAFLGGDPINRNDPSGLDTICDIVASGEDANPVCYDTDPGVNGVGVADDGSTAQVNVEGTSVTVVDTPDPVEATIYDAAVPSGLIWAPSLSISSSNSGGASQSSKSSCITSAVGSGLLHAGIDAIGLIPEGTIVSRAIGNNFMYRGIVADRFGNKTLGAVQMATGTGSTALGANDTSGTGLISTGLGAAGVAAILAGATPVVGQAISVVAIGVDVYSAGVEVANCQ